MPNKMFQLRPKALADITDIYQYSAKQWGIDRAERYITNLNTALQNLADNYLLGRNYSHIKTGLYAYNVASHVIFYRTDNSGILVVRILNKAMDYAQHLIS